MSPKSFGVCIPVVVKRRHAQLAAAKKKTAKPPRMNSAVGKPVSSFGIRNNQPPMAISVSRSTARIGTSVAVARARTIARRSIINTSGQITIESPAS